MVRGITLIELECLQTSDNKLEIKEIAFLKHEHVYCFTVRSAPNVEYNKLTLKYLVHRHNLKPGDGDIDHVTLKYLIDMFCKNRIAIVNGTEKCELLRTFHRATINAQDIGIPSWKLIRLGSEDCGYHSGKYHCALRKVYALEREYKKLNAGDEKNF